MSFISLEYWLFFAFCAAGYFALRGRWQLGWLVGCSVLFYCAYKPAFLFILAGQLCVDYLAGLQIGSAQQAGRPRAAKAWLVASIATNVGLLFSFKYAAWVAGLAGYAAGGLGVGVLVPLGLSFHTFQGIAYTTDVYRGAIAPERRWLPFCNYIFFFPQLVAGPIERPGHFLPQVGDKRFSAANAVAGGRLILWGLVQKMVVADRLALIADAAFAHPAALAGWAAWLGVAAFSVQILADFSGYTAIARGCARVLGYQLARNFAHPYAGAGFADFWRRWHISLSSWFRDYVYLPLGGARVRYGRWAVNILIVFGLSGLWHGAQTTFLVWGVYHGLCLLAERTLAPPPWLARPLMLLGVCLGWVFFRAADMAAALAMFSALGEGLAHPTLPDAQALALTFPVAGNIALTLALAALYLVLGRYSETLATTRTWRLAPVRWAGYYAGILAVLLLAPASNPAFIYFQF